MITSMRQLVIYFCCVVALIIILIVINIWSSTPSKKSKEQPKIKKEKAPAPTPVKKESKSTKVAKEKKKSSSKTVTSISSDFTSFDIVGTEETREQILETIELPGFNDIAGLVEEKDTLKRILSAFKSCGEVDGKSVNIPTGILFYGEPGCGKTMLAKAIAKESGVNFMYRNANLLLGKSSDEDTPISELFRQATSYAPCIVFIDEIDTICARGYVSAEVSEMLAVLDGFVKNSNILVIAATNRINELDPALLRSGRFSKKIPISSPSSERDVEEVVDLYRCKNLSREIPKSKLVELCRGMTPADIKNMFDWTQMNAAIEEYIVIFSDLLKAKNSILYGREESTEALNKDQEKRLAIHEIGHAIMNIVYNRPVDLISIDGTSFHLDVTAKQLQGTNKTVKTLKEDISILYGGVLNEYIFYQSMENVSMGCKDDIRNATTILKDIVNNVSLSGSKGVLLNYATLANSGFNTDKVLEDVERLSQEIMDDVTSILKLNIELTKKLQSKLLEDKCISGYELKEILNYKGVQRKPKTK